MKNRQNNTTKPIFFNGFANEGDKNDSKLSRWLGHAWIADQHYTPVQLVGGLIIWCGIIDSK